MQICAYVCLCLCMYSCTNSSMRACVSCLLCHQIRNCGVLPHLSASLSHKPLHPGNIILGHTAFCPSLSDSVLSDTSFTHTPVSGQRFRDSQNPIGVIALVHTHYSHVQGFQVLRQSTLSTAPPILKSFLGLERCPCCSYKVPKFNSQNPS